jgi:hypothetical protein
LPGSTAEKLLGEYVSAEQLEQKYGIDNLATYFRRPNGRASHALLVMDSIDDLAALHPYKGIITDMKCLIALTNRLDREVYDRAIEFRPRFIAYLPGDIGHLELVLQKITGRLPKSLPR